MPVSHSVINPALSAAGIAADLRGCDSRLMVGGVGADVGVLQCTMRQGSLPVTGAGSARAHAVEVAVVAGAAAGPEQRQTAGLDSRLHMIASNVRRLSAQVDGLCRLALSSGAAGG